MGLEYVVPHMYVECPIELGNGAGSLLPPLCRGVVDGRFHRCRRGWLGGLSNFCMCVAVQNQCGRRARLRGWGGELDFCRRGGV